MAFYENRYYQLGIDEDKGVFDIIPGQSVYPQVRGNRILVEGRVADGPDFKIQAHLGTRADISPDPAKEISKTAKSISCKGMDGKSGIAWQVTFALQQDEPLIYWRVELTNRSSNAVFLDRIILLEPFNSGESNVTFPMSGNDPDLAFHANGWQSWSYTCTYGAAERMRRIRLGLLQEPMVYNPGTPKYRSSGRFSGDFFGVLGDRRSRVGLLLGFLSQKVHFGSLTADIRNAAQMRLWANGDHARLDPQTSIATDWAVMTAFNLDDAYPLDPYLHAVGKAHDIGSLPDAPAGWCSWYYYYQDITAEIIRENLNKITNQKDLLPLSLVQIDDGFQAEVGDWLDFRPQFAKGVKPLADEINAADFTPGLWLAPFIVHPASRLAVEHPDWLLRRKNGRMARAGFVWNRLDLALDLTVPEALEYACKVVGTAAHQWGYPYLKLDFLYAAALKCVYHDPTRTRAQVLRNGMEAIRRSVGDETILLGCGAPLGSMLGLVQAMRIGADVSASWRPKYFGISRLFKREPHMPSAGNSIQNILTRAPLNKHLWVNDPDCLLVRPDSDLSLEEVQTLATAIGMTGGSVLLSDNMTELPPDRLEIAAALLPPMRDRVRVLDWMDAHTPEKLRIDINGAAGKWHVLAYFNWQDEKIAKVLEAGEFDLPANEYWVRSFWDGRVWKVQKSEVLFKGELPPHSTLLAAVRPVNSVNPLYLGSSLHISQGLEVKSWKATSRSLSCEFEIGRKANAVVDIHLPVPPQKATLANRKLTWEKYADDCYRFNFALDKKDTLKVSYQ